MHGDEGRLSSCYCQLAVSQQLTRETRHTSTGSCVCHLWPRAGMFSSLNRWAFGSVLVRFVKGSGGGSEVVEVEGSLSKSLRFTRAGWEFMVEPSTWLNAMRLPLE